MISGRLNYTQRYRLGVIASKEIETVATLDEVAVEFGLTRQNADTECCVALGTLISRIRQRLGLPLLME